MPLPSRADLRLGGSAPYGFRWQGGELVEDVAEQAVLAAMLQLARRGVAPTRITNILNRQEVPTRRGRHWWPATVIKILRREEPELVAQLMTASPVSQRERPAERRMRHREAMRRRRARPTTLNGRP